MEYLRVGIAVFVGVTLFVAWCFRPRREGLNETPPEKAFDEGLAALSAHGMAILMLLLALVALFEGRVDRDLVLANARDADARNWVMFTWSYGTFYLLCILRRVLLGPDVPPWLPPRDE